MNPGSTSPEEIREPQTRNIALGKEAKKPKWLKSRLGYWSFGLFMLGIFVVLPGTDLSMQEYNNTHPSTFRNCTVTQADPHHSTSRKGTDSYKVLIETSDCGAYEWDRGVTESNYLDVAQGITPGEYRLELAATAVAFEGVHKFFSNRVLIESLERTTSR